MTLSELIASIPALKGEAVAVQLPGGKYELMPIEGVRARTALWLTPELVLGTYNKDSDSRSILDDAIAVSKQMARSA